MKTVLQYNMVESNQVNIPQYQVSQVRLAGHPPEQCLQLIGPELSVAWKKIIIISNKGIMTPLCRTKKYYQQIII